METVNSHFRCRAARGRSWRSSDGTATDSEPFRDNPRLLRRASIAGDRLQSGTWRSLRDSRRGQHRYAFTVGKHRVCCRRIGYATRAWCSVIPQCGAIVATIGELQQPTDLSPSLRSIVDTVRPSVEGLFASELRNDREALVEQAVRANVLASVNHLRHGSELLEPADSEGAVPSCRS